MSYFAAKPLVSEDKEKLLQLLAMEKNSSQKEEKEESFTPGCITYSKMLYVLSIAFACTWTFNKNLPDVEAIFNWRQNQDPTTQYPPINAPYMTKVEES